MPEGHFFNKLIFFFQMLYFHIEKVYSKFHIDILEKTLIRTWSRDPPLLLRKQGLVRIGRFYV